MLSSSFSARGERSTTSSKSKSNRRASTDAGSKTADRKKKHHHHRRCASSSSVSSADIPVEKIKYDGHYVCRSIDKETMLRMLAERGISGPSFDLCVEPRDEHVVMVPLRVSPPTVASVDGLNVSFDLAIFSGRESSSSSCDA